MSIAASVDDSNSNSDSREHTLTPGVSTSASFSEAESTDTIQNEDEDQPKMLIRKNRAELPLLQVTLPFARAGPLFSSSAVPTVLLSFQGDNLPQERRGREWRVVAVFSRRVDGAWPPGQRDQSG